MVAEDLRPMPRKRNPLLLPVRLLLRLVITALVLLFLGFRRLLRPKLVRYGLLVLVVVGAIGWNTLGSRFFPQQRASSVDQQTVSVPASSQLPRPPMVEQYLKAQSEYDGAAMWDTMSDRLKQRMAAANGSLDQLQAQLDSARASEQRYTGAVYVGGVALDDGQSVYLYVLTITGPDGSAQVPFTFTVGQDGKIANIQ